MKNFKFLPFLLVLALGLVVTNCTSDDPIYVAGEDGIDGVDGIDGEDGSALVCIECHSDTHRQPIFDSYNLSGHKNEYVMYTGDDLSAYANRTSCAQCHTSDGYIDYISGYPIQEGDGASDPSYSGPQTITCTTCHSDHNTFDFENDGADYALRDIGAKTLIYDNTTVVDFEGTSNMCISCHQPRTTTVPFNDGSGIVTITSSRYGPHHGPQSTFLEGILGANIAGSEAYPGIGGNGDNTHRTGASCVSCHMGETTDGSDGMHSWAPTDNACLTCHTNGAPTEVSNYATDLETLKGLLENIGVLSATGSVVTGDWPLLHAQAVWNYKLLTEDASHGIHNPKYAKALLTNTLEALQAD